MLTGGALTAAALLATRFLAGPLPAPAVSVICLLCAAAVAMERRVRVPGSSWMVPRTWARLGATGYAAAFGALLGTGVATLLPSAALYALLAVAQSAPAWWQCMAPLLAFAAARAVFTLLLTARSVRRGTHPVAHLRRMHSVARRAAPLETALTVTLGLLPLLPR